MIPELDWHTRNPSTHPSYDRWDAGFHDMSVGGHEDSIARLQHPTHSPWVDWERFTQATLAGAYVEYHNDDDRFEYDVVPIPAGGDIGSGIDRNIMETALNGKPTRLRYRNLPRERPSTTKKKKTQKPSPVANITAYLENLSKEYDTQARVEKKIWLIGLLEKATTLEECLGLQLDLLALMKKDRGLT